MLTSVEMYGSRVAPPILALDSNGAASSDPIQILGIDGLGPVKGNINTTPLAEIGEAYSGSSVGKRNIVFTVGLNPNWATQTIESLRLLLYQYVMPMLPIRLVFKSTHLPTCDIRGYVESCEPNIFSKDPQFQISVICPDPYFTALGKSVVGGTVSDGSIKTNIDYVGSVPTGYVLRIKPSTTRPSYEGSVVVKSLSPRVQDFGVTAKIDADGYFELSSVKGQKYVRRVMSSGSTNLLNTVAIASAWPEIYAGPNTLAVQAGQTGQVWELEYVAKFGGL